jgi:hypothetical protein
MRDAFARKTYTPCWVQVRVPETRPSLWWFRVVREATLTALPRTAPPLDDEWPHLRVVRNLSFRCRISNRLAGLWPGRVRPGRSRREVSRQQPMWVCLRRRISLHEAGTTQVCPRVPRLRSPATWHRGLRQRTGSWRGEGTGFEARGAPILNGTPGELVECGHLQKQRGRDFCPVFEGRRDHPGGGGSTHFWNVCRHPIKNTAVHPRRFWASFCPNVYYI